MSNKQTSHLPDFIPCILTVASNQGQIDVALAFLQTQYQFKPNFASQLTVINSNQETITINTIRTLVNELSYAPHLGKTRAIIFLTADQLSLPAQHAILKSLEEPPLNTIILLLTTQSNILLPTILSRCQMHFWQADETSAPMQSMPIVLDKFIFHHQQPNYLTLINLAAEYKKRTEAINLIKLCLWQISLRHHELKLSFFVKIQTILLETLKKLTANCNTGLTLENCFFEIKAITK